MRPTLLKSFLVVTTVWFIATTLAWTLADPETNLANLKALAEMVPWHRFHVPERAHAFNALGIQRQVLSYWTGPILVAAGVAALLGYAAVWLVGWQKHEQRESRERPKGNYRGIAVSVGELPIPVALSRDQVELRADSAVLERLTPAERACLSDVLGVASAWPQTFSGRAGQPFVEHVLQTAERALQASARPGLAAIAAASFELGRITAYKTDAAGQPVLARPLGQEAAKHLAALPSWWQLPRIERMAVLLAVKYREHPRALPNPGDASFDLAKALLAGSSATAQAVPAAAAAHAGTVPRTEPLPTALPAAPAVDESDDRPVAEQLYALFMRFLPQLPFQSPGQPKSVPAVGWKVGTRVYLLENALRNSLTQRLPPSLKAALESGEYAKKTKLPPLTYELVSAFEERGLLVREIGKAKVDLAQPFWKISAGVKDFQRVLILDANDEMLPMLPPQDSYYAVTVLGPQFQQPGNYTMRATELSSLLQ
jgi:hypothetical protein